MIYRFDDFEIDTGSYRLSKSGEPVAVEPLVFDLLVYLVDHCDRVVSRDELFENLWQGKVVTDAALGARIKDLRKVLGDSGERQSVIRTVHGRGYRFVTNVEAADTGEVVMAPIRSAPDTPDMPSLAVLPFRNLGDQPDSAMFAEGITQDITTALARFRNLLLISGEQAMHGDEAIEPRRTGAELGVAYLLEGSVRRLEERVRVNAQLIECVNGRHVWAERYDREIEDLFAVQDEIVSEIVIALDVELLDGEQARAWSSGTKNLEAWEYVRRASHDAFYDVDPATKDRARALLEKALELDPDYAIAWVMLGWIYQQYADVASTASDDEGAESALSKLLDCARKALEADPKCPDACSLMAIYHLEVKAFDEAFEMAEKAIALAPNNAEALSEASMVMNKTGHPDRALSLKKRVMRIWPTYRPGILRGLALSYYLLGRYGEAVDAFEKSIEREPDYLSAHTGLAVIYSELGRDDDARRSAAEVLRLAPDFSVDAYVQGLSFKDREIIGRMESGMLKSGLPR